jgi:hypothetical protein
LEASNRINFNEDRAHFFLKTRRDTRKKISQTIIEEAVCLFLKMSDCQKSTKHRRLIDHTSAQLKIVLLREWLRTIQDRKKILPSTNNSISRLRVPDRPLPNHMKVKVQVSSDKLMRYTILRKMTAAIC